MKALARKVLSSLAVVEISPAGYEASVRLATTYVDLGATHPKHSSSLIHQTPSRVEVTIVRSAYSS